MDISTREYLQIVHVTFSYVLIFFHRDYSNVLPSCEGALRNVACAEKQQTQPETSIIIE